ncbi:hypothetical protein [Wolbachia pipientis]|uniref:hypothetical protein n=1 Tax=Wolbachia pipientis TaxID=955 RepID=UPI001C70FA6F|nr:hypothetical protein [Wolbachia pipientis]
MTGFFEVEEEGNTVIMSIASANEKALIVPEDIKALFGLNDEKKEINVQMLKHPRKQVKELKLGVQELETENKKAENEKQALETANKEANQALETKTQELETKNTEAAKLQKDLKAKEKEIAQLKQQLNAEVESLKKDLKDKNDRVQQLEKKNKELEDKSKTIEQPKQGNGARYTATVGMGLAAGLIAFTALERTVRLDIWVMVGIAVVSTLAVGSITYAALPSTQVNGAEVQGVTILPIIVSPPGFLST